IESDPYVSRTHLEPVPRKPAFKIEMSYKSMKNWDREQREPLLSKVTDRIHHQEPLKERSHNASTSSKSNRTGSKEPTSRHNNTTSHCSTSASRPKSPKIP